MGRIVCVGLALGALACSGAAAPAPATATATAVRAPSAFDFAFVRGAPVTGTRLTACGRVTVTTTHTERFELASFRKDASAEPANVSFAFDRPITTFELTVSHVGKQHALSAFNVGNPPKLSGTLLQTADGKVTAAGEGGQGTLTWTDLAAQEITFVLGDAAVDKFLVDCRPQ
jgi:hypothetical protein